MPLFERPQPPPGHRLGALVVEPDELPTRLAVLSFDAHEAVERSLDDPRDPLLLEGAGKTRWILVQGLRDREMLRALAEAFDLDDYVAEDVTERRQRPKAEWLGDRALIVLRAPFLTSDGSLELDQVGVVLGPDYVLTVQQTHSDLLQPIWERLLRGYGDWLERGAAHLAYALADVVIDSFFPVLEEIGDRLEEIEDDLMENFHGGILGEVNQARSELLELRRAIWPQREAIQRWARNDLGVFPKDLEAPLRDCHDHCLQISEMIESYRELVGAINGTYLSAVGNRTNEVMRVLTIVSTIFIPMTFIAGIYGMNFENMPELSSPYGYPAVWGVMTTLAAAMLTYFHRRGWIHFGRGARTEEERHES